MDPAEVAGLLEEGRGVPTAVKASTEADSSCNACSFACCWDEAV